MAELPPFIPSGSSDDERHTPSAATRRRRQIVGGFAVDLGYRPVGGLSPASVRYEPVFDPYRNGDQRRILQRLVNNGQIMDLQLALVQAGLMDEGDVAFGYLDSDTQDAFANILAIANQNGVDWRDVLSQASQAGGVGGNSGYGTGGSAQLQPTVIQLPNRDDTIAAARETAMTLGGQAIDDDLAEAVADSVLDTLRTQQERQVQRELSATGEGVTFTEGAPDPGRLLEEEIRQRAPDLVMSKGVRDAMDTWFAGLAGPV